MMIYHEFQGKKLSALGFGTMRPSACIGCGKCAKICPQGIDIPGAMKDFSQALSKLPSRAEICRMRDEAAKKKR